MIPRLLLGLFLACSLVPALPAQNAAKKSAPAQAEGGWLKIPDKWLLMHFVQSDQGPRASYKVGLVLQPGAKSPKVTRTSGRPEVDGIAFDYAKHLVEQSAPLKEASKTKELVFNFELSPPAIDSSEKSEEGRQPMPAGEEFHTPIPKMLYFKPNRGGGGLLAKSSFLVVFHPTGGYVKEALVLSSSGDSGRDLFYIRNAVINWRTTRKADRPFGFTFDMTSRRMGFGGRFTNE